MIILFEVLVRLCCQYYVSSFKVGKIIYLKTLLPSSTGYHFVTDSRGNTLKLSTTHDIKKRNTCVCAMFSINLSYNMIICWLLNVQWQIFDAFQDDYTEM